MNLTQEYREGLRKLFLEEREAFDELIDKVHRMANRYSWMDSESLMAYKEHCLDVSLLDAYNSRHGREPEPMPPEGTRTFFGKQEFVWVGTEWIPIVPVKESIETRLDRIEKLLNLK